MGTVIGPQTFERMIPGPFHVPVVIGITGQGGSPLARSNYQFNKRQKELARKKKKEEKRQQKLNKTNATAEDNPDQPQDDGEIVST